MSATGDTSSVVWLAVKLSADMCEWWITPASVCEGFGSRECPGAGGHWPRQHARPRGARRPARVSAPGTGPLQTANAKPRSQLHPESVIEPVANRSVALSRWRHFPTAHERGPRSSWIRWRGCRLAAAESWPERGACVCSIRLPSKHCLGT